MYKVISPELGILFFGVRPTVIVAPLAPTIKLLESGVKDPAVIVSGSNVTKPAEL